MELVLTFLLLPQLQLLGEFWYDQKRFPALAFLRLEDVAKDVVSNIEDVLTFDIQQITNDVRGTCNQKKRNETITK